MMKMSRIKASLVIGTNARAERVRKVTFFVVAIVITAVAVTPEPQGRVAFTKDNELVVANDDGSGAKTLTKDRIPKQGLRWSPDGNRIAYRVAASQTTNSKTNSNIVIVPADGGQAITVPVLKTDADGVFVDGMRFVEESGWYSNSEIFAAGSANPHVAEYRIIDVVSKRVITSYFGFDFATCAGRAKVGYGIEDRADPQAIAFHVEVNETQIYSTNDEEGIRGFRWSEDCDRLAFFEGERNHINLVVLNDSRVEARIDLGGMTGEQSIQVYQGQFFLPNYSGGSIYDPKTQSIKQVQSVVDQFKKRNSMRESVLNRLDGQSADWREAARKW
jgi:hypothetical protein